MTSGQAVKYKSSIDCFQQVGLHGCSTHVEHLSSVQHSTLA